MHCFLTKILGIGCLLGVICFSCTTNDIAVDDSETLRLTIKDISEDIIDLSEYVDSLHQVALQAPENILIGNIMQIILEQDWICFLDSQTRSIHFFDYNGVFLRSIKKIGRGPGEYLNISKILYDENQKQLMVYDSEQRSMLFYDIEGNHIKTISNFADRTPLRDIMNISSGGFLCSRFDRTQGTKKNDYVGLWETDNDGKFIRYLLHENKKYPFQFVQYSYYLYNSPDSGIGYIDHNTYDIFHWSGAELQKKIEFKFPHEKVMKDFEGHSDIHKSFLMPFISHHKGGYLFSVWTDSRDQPFVSLISTKTQQLKTGLTFSNFIGNDLVNSGIFIPNNTKNALISIISSQMLLSIISNREVPEEYKSAARRLVKDKTETEIADMDPVISILFIKD